MDKNTTAVAEETGSSPLYNPVEGITFTTGGHVFHACIHEGYNAFGLIGTECNGVALLSKTDKRIVFAQYACTGMGFDRMDGKRAALKRIVEMSKEELEELMTNSPGLRLRYNPFAEKPKTPALNKSLIKKYLEVIRRRGSCSGYNSTNKDFFHSVSQRLLKKLAKQLGLPKGSYEVRSNRAGTACSGEVTLHGEWAYIQVSADMSDLGILVRPCKGRKDYSGGANRWVSYSAFENINEMAEQVKAICLPNHS